MKNNILDYIQWRGDLRFSQSAANEVDGVLLVFLSFLDFSGIAPENPEDGWVYLKDAVQMCFANDNFNQDKDAYYGAILPNRDIFRMAKLMARSDRFGNAKLTAFQRIVSLNEQEQFAAYTALTDDGNIIVSFQGTDDTLIGWKEDLNMSFSGEIPGQRRAVEYLNKVASVYDGKIRIAGHSKGGNLAVYAASKCAPEVRERISRVYNYDGPGFNAEFLESEDYLSVKNRVLKLVPQESVVGVMLVNDDHYTVINSSKSGVLQHNSFFWEVQGRHFTRRAELTKKSLELGRIMNSWLDTKDIETKKTVADAIYEMLTSADARTLTDFNRDKTLLLKSMAKLDPQKRDMIFKTVMEFLGELIKGSITGNDTTKRGKSRKEDKQL